MSPTDLAGHAGHVLAVLAAVLVLAAVAALVARLVRQPAVIIEIALGLAVGPTVVAIGGHRLLDTLVPAPVFSWVRLVGHVGLVFFLIGMAHELRFTLGSGRRRAVGATVVGGILVPLVMGLAVAIWVVTGGDPALRGTAPTSALVPLLAVSLSVTAVPVLVRILSDRGLTGTEAGRVSMTAAVVIDSVSWLLVALALGLASGGSAGVIGLLAIICGAVAVTVAVRRLLGTRTASTWPVRYPRSTAVAVAAAGLLASGLLQSWGLTEIFGAVLVGFAIPTTDPDGAWDAAVARLSGVGRRLVPVFFVVTGVTVFAKPLGEVPWVAIVVVVVLGIAGKVVGGYSGARIGGLSHRTGLTVGVLLNTRGLTELVVLQAGYTAGILTGPMFLALVVMAVLTTAMTGPACQLLDRAAGRAEARHEATSEEVPR
jgi:Kef-type K+ transport system membrane component KefB